MKLIILFLEFVIWETWNEK